MSESDERIRVKTHEIRVTESALERARWRRKWSYLAIVLASILFVILYSMWRLRWIPDDVRKAVYLPGIPLLLGFVVAAVNLKVRPGYPNRDITAPDKIFSALVKESDLELTLARQRDERKQLLADNETSTKVRRVGYKDDAYKDIDQMRAESKWYRGINNSLQGVLIIGSLAATGVTGLLGELPYLRWVAVGLTFSVGIASGFMGYFKYKERSFYLQQTADAIESEWDAVEIGVGRYKIFGEDEKAALAEFVEEVHRLKSEQMKRQQNLDQPPDKATTD